jgi:hypothetical protein
VCYHVFRDKLFVFGGSDNMVVVCFVFGGVGLSVLSLDFYRFVVNTTG